MHRPFFPDPLFGWLFVLVLAGLLGSAAYVDWRRMLVPKLLTLTALPVGLAFNVARGAWIGSQGAAGWAFAGGNAWIGAADGLVFGLTGFLAGFGLFFVLWILGTCGGGDVKLFAALGAWIGPLLCVWVLGGTLVVVVLFSVIQMTLSFPKRGLIGSVKRSASKPTRRGERTPAAPAHKRLMTYSLPLAIVTILILLWTQRVELQLTVPPAPAAEKGEAHAR